MLVPHFGYCACGISEDATYVLGIEQLNYFPHYSSQHGVVTGFAKEFFDEFAKASNIKLTIKPLPVKRLYQNLGAGQIDLKYPSNPNWKSQFTAGQQLYFSKPIVSTQDVSFVRNEWDDENLSHLGTIVGFTIPIGYQAKIKTHELHLTEVNRISSLINMLLIGRLDAIYINREVGLFYIQEHLRKSPQPTIDYQLPNVALDFHVSSISQPDLITCLDHFLKKSETRILQIKTKYNVH
ncbi:family 3 extracellular solute-binding protein [Oleiphilus messinensis]|uniref:Family 3 extracellular solute-binding protein n=2 Tax=Oleiphilus messinensis TaxID=141451 RepID=A0A1Y0I5Q6_9GAMM|nr:family 3 extracellular solute-binding protein [Oleiphilus messinensis]